LTALLTLALRDGFADMGERAQLHRRHGLDAEGIAARVLAELSRPRGHDEPWPREAPPCGGRNVQWWKRIPGGMNPGACLFGRGSRRASAHRLAATARGIRCLPAAART
jgi:hypothetical protein